MPYSQDVELFVCKYIFECMLCSDFPPTPPPTPNYRPYCIHKLSCISLLLDLMEYLCVTMDRPSCHIQYEKSNQRNNVSEIFVRVNIWLSSSCLLRWPNFLPKAISSSWLCSACCLWYIQVTTGSLHGTFSELAEISMWNIPDPEGLTSAT